MSRGSVGTVHIMDRDDKREALFAKLLRGSWRIRHRFIEKEMQYSCNEKLQ